MNMSTHTYQTPPNSRIPQPNVSSANLPSSGGDLTPNTAIRSLPDSTQSHLEGIFNAVRTQVASWGEHARWKIDLVLLPNEENGAPRPNQSLASPTSASSPTSRPTGHGTAFIPYVPPVSKTNNTSTTSQSCSIPRLAALDEQTINNLDVESARLMLRQAITQIRASDMVITQLKNDLGKKLAEADARAAKANKHIEGMARLHVMREKELNLKHSAEMQIMEEDIKILNRKLKEANSRLAELGAKPNNAFSKPRDIRRTEQRTVQKDKRYTRKKNGPYPLKPERIGEIIEYVPQEQTNGYLTYNFPYTPKLLHTNQSPPESPGSISHTDISHSSPIHLHGDQDSGAHIYKNVDFQAASATHFGRFDSRYGSSTEDRTGLDNLSLAAELLLSAASTLIPPAELQAPMTSQSSEKIQSPTRIGPPVNDAANNQEKTTLLSTEIFPAQFGKNQPELLPTRIETPQKVPPLVEKFLVENEKDANTHKIFENSKLTQPSVPNIETPIVMGSQTETSLFTTVSSSETARSSNKAIKETNQSPSDQPPTQQTRQQPQPQFLEQAPHNSIVHHAPLGLFAPGGPQSSYEFPPKRNNHQRNDEISSSAYIQGDNPLDYDNATTSRIEYGKSSQSVHGPTVHIFPPSIKTHNQLPLSVLDNSKQKVYAFTSNSTNSNTPPPTPPMFQKKTRSPYIKWTVQEDQQLRNAVSTYGSKNWEAIAQDVPGRNYHQCRQRWVKVLKEGTDVADEQNPSSLGATSSSMVLNNVPAPSSTSDNYISIEPQNNTAVKRYRESNTRVEADYPAQKILKQNEPELMDKSVDGNKNLVMDDV